MKHVSIADLKARLSEFIAIAKRGEDVVVTDRGRPVARIAALRGNAAHDAHLEQLVRAGVVRTPERRLPKNFFDLPLAKDPDRLVMKAFLEERAQGW